MLWDSENLSITCVSETIAIIINNVYNHPSLPIPKIKSVTLKKLPLAYII